MFLLIYKHKSWVQKIDPSPIMKLEEKLDSENLNIQSYFHSIVYLSAYWNLPLECIRKHHKAIPFSFQKSSNILPEL